MTWRGHTHAPAQLSLSESSGDLLSIALLLLNDLVLKSAALSLLTGKLSDFVGRHFPRSTLQPRSFFV